MITTKDPRSCGWCGCGDAPVLLVVHLVAPSAGLPVREWLCRRCAAKLARPAPS